uniref:TM160 n=1 Tax=Poeciliopsis prolifica TaxID=188132 RepID=A0A0S7ELY8_9TELE
MAFLTLFVRRQLPRAASYFLGRPGRGGAPLRRLHGSARQRVGEKGPWGKSQRGPEQPLQQYHLTDLDKADALMLRKSHETGISFYTHTLLQDLSFCRSRQK